jgi:cobalamin biosynthesis Mg chelatase CobN
VSHPFARAVRAFLAVWVLAAASAQLSPAASAASPCWKKLMNDWYSPPINNTYPLPCYHQALDHLPTDVQVYSSAREDIQRALQLAIAAQKKKSKPVTHVEPTTTAPTTTAHTTTQAHTTTHASTPKTTTHKTTTAPATTAPTTTKTSTAKAPPHKKHTTTTTPTTTAPVTTTTKKGPIGKAIRDITPGGADSFPLPLLILGILAVVLVAAGVGGMVWRRIQARRGLA